MAFRELKLDTTYDDISSTMGCAIAVCTILVSMGKLLTNHYFILLLFLLLLLVVVLRSYNHLVFSYEEVRSEEELYNSKLLQDMGEDNNVKSNNKKTHKISQEYPTQRHSQQHHPEKSYNRRHRRSNLGGAKSFSGDENAIDDDFELVGSPFQLKLKGKEKKKKKKMKKMKKKEVVQSLVLKSLLVVEKDITTSSSLPSETTSNENIKKLKKPKCGVQKSLLMFAPSIEAHEES